MDIGKRFKGLSDLSVARDGSYILMTVNRADGRKMELRVHRAEMHELILTLLESEFDAGRLRTGGVPREIGVGEQHHSVIPTTGAALSAMEDGGVAVGFQLFDFVLNLGLTPEDVSTIGRELSEVLIAAAAKPGRNPN